MGGGKKNKSLKQMTKTKAPKEPRTKEKTDAQPQAKKSLDLIMPNISNKKVITELKSLKVLTPYVVASRLNIRLSLARDFLNELEKRKMAEYISGGKNLKIYKSLIKISQ